MSKPLVPDALWEIIHPLLPEQRPKPKGGRPPVSNRDALRGISFGLRSDIPWSRLPPEMGCGSGVPCWRRLRDWNKRGVWRKLHQLLLNRLGDADKIDWSRACIDSFSVPAPAEELARCAEKKGLAEHYILPRMDEWDIYPREAAAVGMKAIEQGIAHVRMSRDELFAQASRIIQRTQEETRALIEAGLIPLTS